MPLTSESKRENDENERKPFKQSDTNDLFEISDELQRISLDHQQTLENTVKVMNKILFGIIFIAFDYMLRTNIFVLYARTFDDCPNETIIAIVAYLSYFASGLASLISGFVGVK